MAEGFTVVTGKKAARRKKIEVGIGHHRSVSEDELCKLKTKLEQLSRELENSDFLHEFKSLLLRTEAMRRVSAAARDPASPAVGGVAGGVDVVCYGVGRLSDCLCSQHQLALLMAARRTLKCGRCLVYDPALLEGEYKVLDDLGFSRIAHNEVCKRSVRDPTLFYMVHCSMTMYNNLLWANWTRQQLRNVILVGNPLSSYKLRLTEHDLRERAFYIHQVLPLCAEKELLSCYALPNVFNDTAVQWFSVDSDLQSASLWALRPEPSANDTDDETIFNS